MCTEFKKVFKFSLGGTKTIGILILYTLIDEVSEEYDLIYEWLLWGD